MRRKGAMTADRLDGVDKQKKSWHRREVELVHRGPFLFPRFSSFGKVVSDQC